MMLLDPALEGEHQVVMFAAKLTLGEASDFLGCGVALAQCLEHSPAGHAEDIAGDTSQLDVGSLQQLQQPVAFGRLALDELAAISQQLPQFPKWSCWDEALGD